MDKINVTVQNHDGKDVVLRLGEAEKIVHPKSINIVGILAAPFQFYENKKDSCPADKSHLQIKKDTGEIKLIVLDTDPRTCHTITGNLKNDGYFLAWGINTEKRWTVSQFMKHVKMYRAFFTEPAESDEIVLSLQKWEANVQVVIKEHNDNGGNTLSMLERKISGIQLKTKFKLTIPIFQGYEKKTFTVEVGFEAKDRAVDLYLFSNELFELEILHREALIADELKKFDDFPCSKVVLS